MPSNSKWTNEELLVLIYFRSHGFKYNIIGTLLAHKCGVEGEFATRYDAQHASTKCRHLLDQNQGLIPSRKCGVSTDIPQRWDRHAVDDYLIKLTDKNDVIDRLTTFGTAEREMIGDVGLDRLGGTSEALMHFGRWQVWLSECPSNQAWLEEEQRRLVEKHAYRQYMQSEECLESLKSLVVSLEHSLQYVFG